MHDLIRSIEDAVPALLAVVCLGISAVAIAVAIARGARAVEHQDRKGR